MYLISFIETVREWFDQIKLPVAYIQTLLNSERPIVKSCGSK